MRVALGDEAFQLVTLIWIIAYNDNQTGSCFWQLIPKESLLSESSI